jgi:hypothetical protein
MLLKATTKPGEAYADLEELYGRLLGQWVLEMNHVAALVGGFDSRQKHGGQDGVRFLPIPRARQVAAVRFLNEHAFKPPSFALQPDVLRRIEPAGVLERLETAQQRVFGALLAPARMARLVEQEAIDGAAAYKPTDFLRDLRTGVWSELGAPEVKIDAYRRNTQRLFIEVLADRLNGRTPVTDDARAFFRGELRTLNASLAAALPKARDRATRLHLEDARDQIAKALDPRFARPAPVPGGPQSGLDGEFVDDADGKLFEEIGPLNCFPDFAIRRETAQSF